MNRRDQAVNNLAAIRVIATDKRRTYLTMAKEKNNQMGLSETVDVHSIEA